MIKGTNLTYKFEEWKKECLKIKGLTKEQQLIKFIEVMEKVTLPTKFTSKYKKETLEEYNYQLKLAKEELEIIKKINNKKVG